MNRKEYSPTQQAARLEGLFFIAWGYITLLICVAIYLHAKLLWPFSTAWLWIALPTLGCATSAKIVRYSKRLSLPLFGSNRRFIGVTWMTLGPSIGALTISGLPFPLGAQLTLIGCGMVLSGWTLNDKPALICGIAAILSSMLLPYLTINEILTYPMAVLLFGALTLIGMGLPGHIRYATAGRKG